MNAPPKQLEANKPRLSVTCIRCGAPLSIPGEVRFVTCTHCRSTLVVQWSEGAAHTKVLDAIDQRTERIEREVAELRIREQIDQLDHQWAIQYPPRATRDNNGRPIRLTAGSANKAAFMIGVFGVFFAVLAATAEIYVFAVVIAVAFVFLAMATRNSVLRGIAKFEQAEVRYKEARQKLQEELGQLTLRQ